jgi:DNA (cytosine-5)-methyltransferase 1
MRRFAATNKRKESNVDNSKNITMVEWCAGYGGIHLGLKRAIPNLRVIAYGEIEAFACANLVAKMEAGLLDAAPIWTDIKTFPCEAFRDRVDILVAGYPCQPFSAAGKRLGTEDPRHLWPHIARAIRVIRPRMCFFENVEGHISLGLREVVGELEQIGYTTAWGIFSASEVGAPHQRKRVFILAYRNDAGWQAGWHHAISSQGRQPHELAACGGDQRGAEELADSQCAGLEGFHNGHAPAVTAQDVGADAWAGGECDSWPSRPGQPQHGWEPPRVVGNANELRPQGRHDTGSLQAMGISRAELTGANSKHHRGPAEPSLGRDADGPAGGLDYAELCVSCDNRTDELRLLGNGVVPATAERAFRVLIEQLDTPPQTH